MRAYYLLFALCVPSSAFLSAATITATSCSFGHVQIALSLAQAGDTVQIPAGTCEWTQQLAWTAPPNVTVRGAGDQNVTGGGDVTVIVDKFNSRDPFLVIATNNNGTFRLTGLTIRGNVLTLDKYHGIWQIYGSTQVRIDHIHFHMGYHPAAFGIETNVKGVFDHSIVDMAGQPFKILGTDNLSWAEPTGLGGSDFLFLESNIFDAMATGKGTATADCYFGAKYVLRRNEMRWAGTEMHPTAGNTSRGCRATEVYQNNVTGIAGVQPAFNFYWISSGVNMVWGNDVPRGFAHLVTLHAMRRNNATYPNAPPPTGWGYCGTSFNGQGTNWDGNTDLASGYPCMDQPGRGQGDLLSGGLPNVTNVTRGCGPSQPCANPRQRIEPLYEWSNNFAPEPGWGGAKITPYEGEVLAENRDWYQENGRFDGTSGTGTGPLASRPATCAKGVYYWATDQGEWDSTHPGPDGQGYQCYATNTWGLYYRPYAFPHPLITGIPAPGQITQLPEMLLEIAPPPPPPPERCDLNADAAVNAVDLQRLVNAIMTGTAGTAEDLDASGQATAVDIQLLVNVILGLRSCP